MKLNEQGRQKLDRTARTMVGGKNVKLCSDALRPVKERTVDSSGFSAEESIISVTAVPHREESVKERHASF